MEIISDFANRETYVGLSNPEIIYYHDMVNEVLEEVAFYLKTEMPNLIETNNPNTLAAASPLGVTYNPWYLAFLLSLSCNDQLCIRGILIGILAHELVHIIYRDFYASGNNIPRERRADYVAGNVIAAAGFSHSDFSRMLSFVSECSITHPCWSTRNSDIFEGFRSYFR